MCDLVASENRGETTQTRAKLDLPNQTMVLYPSKIPFTLDPATFFIWGANGGMLVWFDCCISDARKSAVFCDILFYPGGQTWLGLVWFGLV